LRWHHIQDFQGCLPQTSSNVSNDYPLTSFISFSSYRDVALSWMRRAQTSPMWFQFSVILCFKYSNWSVLQWIMSNIRCTCYETPYFLKFPKRKVVGPCNMIATKWSWRSPLFHVSQVHLKYILLNTLDHIHRVWYSSLNVIKLHQCYKDLPLESRVELSP